MYKAGVCVITVPITLLINNQQNPSFVHHVSLTLQVLRVITAPIPLLINNQQNPGFVHHIGVVITHSTCKVRET
jgi:hypothetical protein